MDQLVEFDGAASLALQDEVALALNLNPGTTGTGADLLIGGGLGTKNGDEESAADVEARFREAIGLNREHSSGEDVTSAASGVSSDRAESKDGQSSGESGERAGERRDHVVVADRTFDTPRVSHGRGGVITAGGVITKSTATPNVDGSGANSSLENSSSEFDGGGSESGSFDSDEDGIQTQMLKMASCARITILRDESSRKEPPRDAGHGPS